MTKQVTGMVLLWYHVENSETKKYNKSRVSDTHEYSYCILTESSNILNDCINTLLSPNRI